MAIRTVLVCEAQVPFVSGGAERLSRRLVEELRRRGLVADLVSVPFKWYPKDEVLAHAAAWRLLDLSESNGTPVDLLIATKFPTYFARHPNKVAWLVHQHRAAYELCGTEYGEFDHTELDVGLRERLLSLDTSMLAECRRRYAIARNVTDRLERYNGLRAEPIYHPPPLADQLVPGPLGDYLLAVGRLEPGKRVDLAIRAMEGVPGHLRLLVAGEGTQRANLQQLARSRGVADRVVFLGAVPDQQVVGLYAGALGVVFVPFDEDYGYVTLEAFLAHKPVVTALDAGGPLEFVEHGVNGLICEPSPGSVADAIGRLDGDRRNAAALGDAGFERARAITWDGVVERLVHG
jgi:glycosyltransferase involved in cell wall biosynthesis